VFAGRDRYAAFALASVIEPGSSFADGDIHVAARGVSDSVIPGHRGEGLRIVGEQPEQASAIRETLLGAGSRELWSQYDLASDLRRHVHGLIYDGEVMLHVNFERSSPTEPHTLVDVTWLAPETIRRRRAPEGVVYEQFASHRAFEGSGYLVTGPVCDRLVQIPEHEVLHLRWPLDQPRGRSPALAALKNGQILARESRRTLLAARAGAEPGERFLTLARARSGAYQHALDRQKIASARIKDMLYYAGAWEAAVFPWIDAGTEYFLAERILRSRIAICRIRAYLLEQLNEQLLARWTALNNWGQVRIELSSDAFSEADWRHMRCELDQGTITLADIQAAVAAEGETARSR
jgi:hypothetical protein